MKFTDASIRSLKPKSERFEKWETNGRGFGLRVSPSARKTFLFMYRYFGVSRRMTIGVYPAMTLSEARTAHATARQKLEKGIDPGRELVEKRKGERDASTINGLIDEYIELYAKPKKRSWSEDSRMLKKDVLPRWGNRKASEIKKRDVVLLLDQIVARGAGVVANRTLRLLRTMFSFAVKRGILDFSPCSNVDAPNTETPRERVLGEDEVRKIWFGLDRAQMSEGTRLILKLLLLTGQRNGEVVGAEWKEFDLNKQWWIIPGERIKNKKTHRVFLAQMAVDILKDAKNLSGESKWVFPSIRGRHITPRAISQAIRNNSEERPKGHPKHKPPYGNFFEVEYFVPHDLRRTVATIMAESGIDEFHVAKVLNHSTPGVTAKHYNRHTYDVEKRKALEKWARKLESILSGKTAKIVNLQRK